MVRGLCFGEQESSHWCVGPILVSQKVLRWCMSPILVSQKVLRRSCLGEQVVYDGVWKKTYVDSAREVVAWFI